VAWPVCSDLSLSLHSSTGLAPCDGKYSPNLVNTFCRIDSDVAFRFSTNFI
uniref:Uncharacterized protein n=1 Tax=Oryza brachyantha TaxID=4533 RepID=J3NED4_ORYBR